LPKHPAIDSIQLEAATTSATFLRAITQVHGHPDLCAIRVSGGLRLWMIALTPGEMKAVLSSPSLILPLPDGGVGGHLSGRSLPWLSFGMRHLCLKVLRRTNRKRRND
jgi:hypothetical protein